MKPQKLHDLVQDFRAITESKAPEGRPDGQLLHDFASRQDETAFAVLVRRHGPMVLGVCRRILRQVEDAEDAFQATFLVLVRKARALGRREILGNWLHGVACNTALKARAAAATRRAREKAAAKCEATVEETQREALAILDRELSLLPEHYRAAIVLCDLEGKTQKEAAQQLGCPEGTLAGRLARGRALLAKRVARHDVTLAGTALTAPLPQFASAPVPSALVVATVRTASVAVPTTAVVLANSVVRGLLLAKLKTVGVCVAGFCLAGVAIGVFCVTLAGKWASGDPPAPPAKQLAQRTALDDARPKSPSATQADQPETGRDRFNDLLPKWAVARLGTVAFRHGLAPFWDTSLNFSLDDKHLVSAGGGWLRRWDVATGHASVNLGDGGFTNKGMLFPQTLFYFSSADGKIARVIDNQVTFVKGQATGEFAGGRAITENNLESGEERAYRLQLSESRDNSESPRADVLSPDGKTFAVVTRTGDLALWNAVDGTATHYLTPTIDVFTRLAFHPDGKSVVVGDDSHNIRIFDLATGNEQRTFGSTDGGAIYRMAISPNGKWLVSLAGKMHGKASGNWLQVGPLDSFLRLWNLEKGKEELKIDMSPNDGGVARSARISLTALPASDWPGVLNFPRLHPIADTTSNLPIRINQS